MSADETTQGWPFDDQEVKQSAWMRAASPPGADRMRFQNGAFFSLLPAGVIVSFLGRGWAAHSVRAALIGLIGLVAAGALGGVIIHLSSEFLGPAHLLMGHISVPFALAIVGLYPVGALLRHFRAQAELS